MDLLMLGSWFVLGIYSFWFFLKAEAFQPLTLDDLALTWELHKEHTGCKASRVESLVMKGDDVVGFKCGCGYEFVQKRLITQRVLTCAHKGITGNEKMEEELRRRSKHLEELVEERTRKLLESEEKYRLLTENQNDVVFSMSMNGRVLYCSPAIKRFAGYDPEEVIGEPIDKYIASDGDVTKVFKAIRKVCSKKQSAVKELLFQPKHADPFSVEVAVTPLIEKGTVKAIQCIMRDITERKRLQDELLQSEKLAAIGQLAASVGHELRNPLGVIKNSIYFLNMKLKDTGNQKVNKHLQILEREVDSANLIISGILDFAREKPPILHEADLNRILADALPYIPIPKNINVTTKLAEMPKILLDEEQIRIVFRNLVLNAVQAMPQGGQLVIQTAKLDDSVKMTVKDTGVGIPRENLPELFTPLFSTKAKGVGLGLTICKQIVEGHDGDITVESRESMGSTFTVTLPIRESEPTEGLPTTTGLPSERRTKSG